MVRHLIVVAGVLMLSGVAGLAQTGHGGADRPAPADAFEPGDARPGRSTRLPRRWEGQPPLVPHSLRGLAPVTPKSNACVRCHGRAGATSGPPPAPLSHFVDARHAPAEVRADIAPARYVCTACHVVQTNAPPLVGSTFDAGPRPVP